MLIIPTYEKVYLKKRIITSGKYCHFECDYLKNRDWCDKYSKKIKESVRCRLCRKKYKDTE